MSTRALYTFKDENETLHVYKHCDGYPTGAAQAIVSALAFAWPLPRYEADEFAAAFVCANKLQMWMQTPILELIDKLAKLPRSTSFDDKITSIEFPIPSYAIGPCPGGQGGNVRLMQSGSVEAVAPGDIQYRYEVTQDKKGLLHVAAFNVDNWGGNYKEKRIFKCKLAEFAERAKAYENKKQAAA